MIEKEISLKKLIIIILSLIIIIFAFIQIRNTLARYETTTSTSTDVGVAFWLVEDTFATQNLIIDEIYPATEPFTYQFTVNNHLEEKIAETDFEYYLVLTSTTNLPLKLEVFRNDDTEACATFDPTDNTTTNKNQLITDDDGTKYVRLELGTADSPFIINSINDTTKQKAKVTDTFVIKATFPVEMTVDGNVIENRENEEYADLMEDVKLTISAQQIIE